LTWNLLKMAVFDSALGRPTPDYPLLQTGLSKKPKLASKPDIDKNTFSPESIKPARQQIPINNSSFG